MGNLTNIRTFHGTPANDSFLDDLSPQLKVDPNATGGAPLATAGGRLFTRANSESMSATDAALSIGAESYWAFCWVKMTTTLNTGVMNWAWNGANSILFQSGLGLSVWHANTNTVSSTGFEAGEWVAAFVCYDHATPSISCILARPDRGSLTTSGHSTPVVRSGSSPTTLTLGSYSGTNFLDGAMKGVCFGKSQTLSGREIFNLLYGGGRGIGYEELTSTQKTDLGLVEWWAMNQPSGNEPGLHAGIEMVESNTVTTADWIGSGEMRDESTPGLRAVDDAPSGLTVTKSLEFFDDAAPQVASIKLGETLDDDNTGWCVSVWAKHNAYHSDGFLMSISSSHTIMPMKNGLWWIGGGYRTMDAYTATDNAWHHFALSALPGQSLKAYVDGVEIYDHGSSSSVSFSDVRLGEYSNGNQRYLGFATDFRVFDHGLTDDEVLYLSSVGVSGTDPGSYDWGSLNTDSDFDSVSITTTKNDSFAGVWSIHGGNHGTITGFTNETDIISPDVPDALALTLDHSMKFGANQYVDNSNFSVGVSEEFTAFAFVKCLGTVNTPYLFANGNNYIIGITSSQIYTRLTGGGGGFRSVSIGRDIRDDEWHTVCVRRDSSDQFSARVDGVNYEFGSGLSYGFTVATLSYSSGSTPGLLGNMSKAQFYVGHDLTDDEVLYLETNGESGTAPTATPTLNMGSTNASFPVGTAADSQPVTVLPSVASVGNHLHQPTAANKPVMLASDVNGLNVIDFDGATTMMEALESFDARWFIVVCSTNVDSFVDVLFADDGGTMAFRGHSSGTIRHNGNSWDASDFLNADGTLFIDGTTDAYTYSTDEYTMLIGDRPESRTLDLLQVGGETQYSRYADHLKVAYMLFFNTYPTKSEKAQALSYCRSRFGL